MERETESDWKVIGSAPLARRVAQGVSELIRRGGLREGQRLPPIRELARRYRTSFSTARFAVERLERIGLVESFHGSGTYVRRRAKLSTPIERTCNWAAMFLDGRAHIHGNLGLMLTEQLRAREMMPVVFVGGAQASSPAEMAQLLSHGPRGEAPHAVVLSVSDRDPIIRSVLPPHTRIIVAMRSTQWAPSTWHSVNPDYFAAFEMAARYLIERGHRRIGLVVKPRLVRSNWKPTHRKAWMPQTQQILGAGQAMRDAGIRGGLSIHYNLPVDTDPSGIPTDPANLRRMARWLSQPDRPTAIIAEDFRMLGVRRAALHAGLRVPQDLTLISVGGTFLADSADHTHVCLQFDLIAEHIVRLITADENEVGDAAQHVAVPPRLIDPTSSTQQPFPSEVL